MLQGIDYISVHVDLHVHTYIYISYIKLTMLLNCKWFYCRQNVINPSAFFFFFNFILILTLAGEMFVFFLSQTFFRVI